MNPFIHFDPPVIAHRGASAYAPENTMAAFVKAAQLGIKWVELDVMQAADGEPIIFHDEHLERTTNGHGEVHHFSYAHLSQLDAGSWFNPKFASERVPTLKALLDALRNMNLSANIEIKSLKQHEALLIKRVLKEAKSRFCLPEGRLLFSSFSLDALHLLREYAPTCLLGLLLDKWEDNWESICLSLKCVSIHVNHTILTREYAQHIKQMDKRLLCYTVNDIERARELYSWGVDAVFSDRPDKILAALHIGSQPFN